MADNVFIYEMAKLQTHPAPLHQNVRNVPWNAIQSIEATSSDSSDISFADGTNFITVRPTVDILVEFAEDNPGTTADSWKIPADESHDFWITPETLMVVKTA